MTVAKVTDSKGVAAGAPASVQVPVQNVSGQWRVTFGGGVYLPKMVDVIQNGALVAATMNSTDEGTGAAGGSVANPRSLALSLAFEQAPSDPFVVTFIGTIESTLTLWTGTVTGLPACPCNFTATGPSATPA